MMAARALLGVTQQELADMAGLSRSAIMRHEAGKHVMRGDSLRAVVRALAMRGVRFVEETDDIAMGVVLLHSRDRTEA